MCVPPPLGERCAGEDGVRVTEEGERDKGGTTGHSVSFAERGRGRNRKADLPGAGRVPGRVADTQAPFSSCRCSEGLCACSGGGSQCNGIREHLVRDIGKLRLQLSWLWSGECHLLPARQGLAASRERGAVTLTARSHDTSPRTPVAYHSLGHPSTGDKGSYLLLLKLILLMSRLSQGGAEWIRTRSFSRDQARDAGLGTKAC